MSSKLVRKGLELLNKDADLRSHKRKGAQKGKRPSEKRKGVRAVKDKQRARGVQNQGLRLSTGQARKEQPVDFTEQNLEYFKKATWRIKGDTYEKILERQKKFPRNKNLKEKQEDSDTEKGGLFDD